MMKKTTLNPMLRREMQLHSILIITVKYSQLLRNAAAAKLQKYIIAELL